MLQVSSTGEIGEALRSDERAYLNYPDLVSGDNLGEFLKAQDNFFASDRYPSVDVSRYVLRGVFNHQAAHEIFEDRRLSYRVEAASPITSDETSEQSQERDETPDYLVYFSRNDGFRTLGTVARKAIAAQTRPAIHASRQSQQPEDSGAVLPPDFRFVERVNDAGQLTSLWEETFGWTQEGCEAFAALIGESEGLDGQEKSTWFQGIESPDGVLVAAAMAERLNMPSSRGQVALIEHTEWSALRQLRGQGLGKLTVQSLTSRLKEDLGNAEKLIFAECNITSGAHIVAVRTGFEAPVVETAHGRVDQVLYANVRVGDGFEPSGGYRNFLFTVAK